MRRVRLYLIFFSLLVSGCSATGPTWEPEQYTLPATTQPATGILVGDFHGGSIIQTITYSEHWKTSQESIRAEDLAGELSRRLQGAGVPTRARMNPTLDDLQEGELLLKGSILVHDMEGDLETGAGIGKIVVCVCTLSLVGVIFPSWPSYASAAVEINFQLVDRDGNIVSSDRRQTRAKWRALWLWQGMDKKAIDAKSHELMNQAMDRLARALKGSLQLKN